MEHGFNHSSLPSSLSAPVASLNSFFHRVCSNPQCLTSAIHGSVSCGSVNRTPPLRKVSIDNRLKYYSTTLLATVTLAFVFIRGCAFVVPVICSFSSLLLSFPFTAPLGFWFFSFHDFVYRPFPPREEPFWIRCKH
ncbi:hypothetical protein TbgDal_X3320 [Trypanosoma brucei gambiense DAL972]|uniref:Uncharacterized protein n=1 Tax=Trypanosoma brucei gambiense (strain MHOM/CI/86/DAL972) TaxID=679716 RepID=D0A1V4_TRYB9|nr:hypothetical protein TbgDal_X3320 [Trypanosoma brucei gambiense DAL972]CBH15247.1 hypothetical protein TbgDal_X3320 [Trypanosoma brucei gambiense DAL972]|eukprot:XP_011777512.1 hypothetical protein TbgDal_X3320 [Trypanosoma brucei gambiense DAL972]